jgi:heme/copper-type cytochrome/quinol oxidase subunit 2
MKVGIRDELILRLQIPRVIPHPALHIVLLHTVVVAAIVLIQVEVAVVVVVVEVRRAAEKKFQEINDAKDRIYKARGL